MIDIEAAIQAMVKTVEDRKVDITKVVRLEVSIAVWASLKKLSEPMPPAVVGVTSAIVGHYQGTPVRMRTDLQPNEWTLVLKL